MDVKLPIVWAHAEKTRIGQIRQILLPVATISCTAVPYTSDKVKGYVLTTQDGSTIYLIQKKPKANPFSDGAAVVVAAQSPVGVETLDLTQGEWFQHPAFDSANAGSSDLPSLALESWRNTFHFVAEDASTGIVGLRKPQIGALHAIHAHWSTSKEIATVVMPTGTGKTETMLATLTSVRCSRVLVIVPTDALRTQVAEKFESLGFLKAEDSLILLSGAQRPVVGTLKSGPKTVNEAADFFRRCNVVVTTSQLAGGFEEDVAARVAELCSHLFIDEAHHAEAATWKRLRVQFQDKRVLQFTATPFREDGQKLDGKLIYVYPLRQAQEEGYFRKITFRPVREFNVKNSDRKIALAAMQALDEDTTGKHIVMARVADTKRAAHILSLYQELGRYAAVMIHSGMTATEREASKRQLFNGTARVVVCVDMLGEGFDLPELKIAAFHDIRKSLSVTLQLAGRFTRSRTDLGDPVFIANTALIDVQDELRKLYAQDTDWNVLLPELSAAAIDEEVLSQEFFQGFGTFLDEVPLKDIRPAASMVVYSTACTNWTPLSFRRGFKGLTSRDRTYHSLNEVESTLVVLTATEELVRWSDIESIRETVWELFIAVWDREKALLYLHGSGNNGEYRDVAKALCGHDVKLIVDPQVFRSFHGVKRLVLNNVGLDEHLGRLVRYTGRMGSDVEARIGHAERRGAKRSVLAGKGFEKGQKTSVGAAKRGRVWSNQRLRVDSFASWARAIGAKLANETIDPDEVLAGTLKPVAVGTVPRETAIAVDWPKEVYERTEHGIRFYGVGVQMTASTDVDIEVLERDEDGPIEVRIFGDSWEVVVRLELYASQDSFDFRFVHARGAAMKIQLGSTEFDIETFFTEHPPVIWFADGASLEGCEHTQLPNGNLATYDSDKLIVLDWSGVDISSESQKEEKRADSIQRKIIDLLQESPGYAVIFDDDGCGEAADVLAITVVENDGHHRIDVELYHLKYSTNRPGARVDDLYVVCGQAQRSTCWLSNHDRRTDLFTHLLKRDDHRVSGGRPTRFERGDTDELHRIREMSRRCEVRLKVFVVQPGLSKAAATPNILTLLAVTERYLSDTYEVPFALMCSA